jgi:photosystem II stability/assembly factor-like uncharacterized protein
VSARRAGLGGLRLATVVSLSGFAALAAAQETTTFVNISPDTSTLHASDPDGASGGRINGLASVAGDNQTFYAASEFGGLHKSTDGGQTWFHLPHHVPHVTWDVEVDSSSVNRVYATSFYDGRVNSLAGISLSTDAGGTWARPATTAPPAALCDVARREEPSAFGISVDPANAARVFIGTNCGVARTTDSGATWTFVDPTPGDPATDVWDVVVHHGVVDVCGDDGHLRSTDGGTSWVEPTGAALPSGRCSITASPDEAHVLFAVVGTSIFESDDGGQSWPIAFANRAPQGRIPFLETNNRGGAAFDLWFGDVSVFRASCTTPTPATPGGAQRCPASGAWAGGFTRDAGAHDDSGAIVFDTVMATNRCPRLFSSDGGVYRNSRTASPACHAPAWEQPTVTPKALWHTSLTGVRRPTGDTEHLYHGNQDNGSFGTLSGGAAGVTTTWNNQECCDGFDVAADANVALTTICCFNPPPGTRLFRSAAGIGAAPTQIDRPPGTLKAFQHLRGIQNIGDGDFVAVTSQGVFITTDINASPVAWTELGATTQPANPCGIAVANEAGTLNFFVKSGGCNGDQPGQLFRFAGTGAGNWTAVPSAASVGVFAVDPNDRDRIIASHLPNTGPGMRMTTNGGGTWTAVTALDNLMTDGGVFRYQNRRGFVTRPGSASGSFLGYPQPTMVAIDPEDGANIVAASADAGVFLSRDGGTTWTRRTNPHTPDSSGRPHIPRARYAHFDHDNGLTVYLGTQGRGTWRMQIKRNLVSICVRRPELCGGIRMERDLVELICPRRECVILDKIPENCLVKWSCPGCAPGALCPPWYHLVFDQLPRDWDVRIVDELGDEVSHRRFRGSRGLALSFRPPAAEHVEKSIGKYALVFVNEGTARPNQKVRFKTRLKTGDAAPKDKIAWERLFLR